MKISIFRIKSLLGLAPRAPIPDRAAAMMLVKNRIAAARREGNDELAAELSQVRQRMKRRPGRCPECGVPCRGRSCRMHVTHRAPRKLGPALPPSKTCACGAKMGMKGKVCRACYLASVRVVQIDNRCPDCGTSILLKSKRCARCARREVLERNLCQATPA